MEYFITFIYVGLICLIGQVILDNTKLMPSHVNVMFVILGALLSMLGIYESIYEIVGVGSSLPITNFGYILYKGSFVGFKTKGFLGLFTNVYAYSALGISITILSAFLVGVFTKPKN